MFVVYTLNAGTIFGELLNHSTLFAGENDIDQIYRVIQTLGKPDEADWPVIYLFLLKCGVEVSDSCIYLLFIYFNCY